MTSYVNVTQSASFTFLSSFCLVNITSGYDSAFESYSSLSSMLERLVFRGQRPSKHSHFIT